MDWIITGAVGIALFFGLLCKIKNGSRIQNKNRPLKIGHRGASGYCPENTISAFDRAVQMGADFIEIDIQLSKDGTIIVCHDYTLKRTTEHEGKVSDFSAQELKGFDAGSWFDPAFKHERIPTLAEVLDKYLHHAGLLIEIKHPGMHEGIENKLAEELIMRNVQRSPKIMIHSFSIDSMKKVHQLLPDIQAGVLFKYTPRGIPEKTLAEISEFASFVNPKWLMINKKLIKRIRSHNMFVFTWTVNRKRYIKKFSRLGINGITTDFPDYF